MNLNAEEQAYARERMGEILGPPAPMRVMTSSILDDSYDEAAARRFHNELKAAYITINAEIAEMRAAEIDELVEEDDVPEVPKLMLAPQ